MNTILSLGLLSFALTAATACASSSANDAALGSAGSKATAAQPAADLSGTWAFALASSDVAAPLRDKCA